MSKLAVHCTGLCLCSVKHSHNQNTIFVLGKAIIGVIFGSVNPSVADPDPDPAYNFDADPDPTFHLNADPDNPGSNNNNKRGGGKICCSNFFVAANFTKIEHDLLYF
jgi:hypothetical protein